MYYILKIIKHTLNNQLITILVYIQILNFSDCIGNENSQEQHIEEKLCLKLWNF